MTKQEIMTEAEEWLRTPNRAVELYKRGEPTFEVDATSHEDLNRFRSVLMSIPDLELLALVKLEGHSSVPQGVCALLVVFLSQPFLFIHRCVKEDLKLLQALWVGCEILTSGGVKTAVVDSSQHYLHF